MKREASMIERERTVGYTGTLVLGIELIYLELSSAATSH